MKETAVIEGGVTAPGGFRAAGVHCGIKAEKPDLALIVSDRPAAIAGVFTTNRVQAAPVRICREKLAGRTARAIVINSGSANACTGAAGRADAEEIVRVTAELLGVEPAVVFPCSTGTIGRRLPVDKIKAGLELAVGELSAAGGAAAARAIMTTDTVPKQYAVRFEVEGRQLSIGGMAKGAGMIEPNMATMLAFLTTDAPVEAQGLQAAVKRAVDAGFNRISVDGDRSTNDTVLAIANGASGGEVLSPGHTGWPVFCSALEDVSRRLAFEIVRDGEGATRFVTVSVAGAASHADADRAARAVANSLLVKTSWYGGDPNWGRVIDAVGYSGADVDESRVEIAYDGVCAVLGGTAAPGVTQEDLGRVIRRRAFAVEINLHLGNGEAVVYTCDCSEEYVRINSAYMT